MHSRNFGSEKIIRTTSTPSCKPGWNFAVQVPARFGGKSHGHPHFWRLKNNNKADSFFRIYFNVYIDVDNRQRARAGDKKNKGDKFRLKNNMEIL